MIKPIFCKKCKLGSFIDESHPLFYIDSAYDLFSCDICDDIKEKLKKCENHIGFKFGKDYINLSQKNNSVV